MDSGNLEQEATDSGMSSEATATINELMQLARDRSERSRRLLVENITDLFLSEEGRLSDHERSLMSDILCKLVAGIEKEVKKELADRLSDVEAAPEDLLVMLGKEDIDVARPILERSQVLKDPALIEIIRQRTDEHRLAIALRHGISSEVTDALLVYGDEDVIETLLRNPDAELSHRAMEYLVAESKRIDRFQEPLVNRNDLPPEFAHRMFWWVSAAVRRHILLNYQIDENHLDDAIQGATRQVLARQQEEDNAMDHALALVTKMQDKGTLTVGFLIQALRQERTPLFVAGLAVLAEIPMAMAWRIFSDHGGESLTVACKAVGMERADFTAIFLLICQARAGGAPQDPVILKTIIELYDRIDAKSAYAALAYWRRDGTYQAAIDDLADI